VILGRLLVQLWIEHRTNHDERLLRQLRCSHLAGYGGQRPAQDRLVFPGDAVDHGYRRFRRIAARQQFPPPRGRSWRCSRKAPWSCHAGRRPPICSFGGKPKLSAHHALATLNEVIAGGMTGWVLEADLKNFFGSLNHDVGAPVCRTSSRRSAPDQLDPALVESGRLGRWSGSSERAAEPRKVDRLVCC